MSLKYYTNNTLTDISNMFLKTTDYTYRKTALKGVGGQTLVNGEIWDIVDYNSDYTIATLHKREPTSEMVYDAREAIFAFPTGLEAGDYYFTVADQPWYAEDVGKTMSFTLTKSIPAGGQLVLNNVYNTTMVGSIISSFDNPSATFAIEKATLSIGNNGTNLGTLTNLGTHENHINSIQKGYMGSNLWVESAQRQWLNSDKLAGSVWTPQSIFDRPPTWVSNRDGFMVGLDGNFLSVVLPTTYITCRVSVSDGGGYDVCTDKFYLPSRTEIFGTNEINGISEGALYSFYRNATNNDRIKYQSDTPCTWRLRTPTADYAGCVRHVSTTGELGYYTANTQMRVAPVCRVDLTQMDNNDWLKNNLLKNSLDCTAEEYEAINPHDPDTIYVVTQLDGTIVKYLGDEEIGYDKYYTIERAAIVKEEDSETMVIEHEVIDVDVVSGTTAIYGNANNKFIAGGQRVVMADTEAMTASVLSREDIYGAGSKAGGYPITNLSITSITLTTDANDNSVKRYTLYAASSGLGASTWVIDIPSANVLRSFGIVGRSTGINQTSRQCTLTYGLGAIDSAGNKYYLDSNSSYWRDITISMTNAELNFALGMTERYEVVES